jgi:gluconolactonase
METVLRMTRPQKGGGVVDVVEIAAGIGFTEGPLWTRDDRLLVTSMSRGLVYEVALDGGVVAQVETGGGPNGLAQDDEGTVWVAQNGGVIVASRSDRPVTPGLQTFDHGDVQDTLVEGCLAPNDLVQGPDGRVWFTDPGGPGNTAPGRVCAYDQVSCETEVLAEGIAYPNGLAFDDSGEVFYLAETRSRRLLRYRWQGSALQDAEVFATLPAGPDGLAVDADGTVYAALPEADMVAVLAPDGTQREPIRLDGPAFPTNVCLAGSARDVVVTAAKGGRVLRISGG